MGRKKINWAELKVDYMKNSYANLKAFADVHELNHGTVRTKCAGWAKEKASMKTHVAELALDDLLADDVMTVQQRNQQHIAVWDGVLANISAALHDYDTLHYPDGSYKVAALERLANTMEKAQKGQRLALQMDKDTREAKGMLSEISAAIEAAKAAYGGEDDGVQ